MKEKTLEVKNYVLCVKNKNKFEIASRKNGGLRLGSSISEQILLQRQASWQAIWRYGGGPNSSSVKVYEIFLRASISLRDERCGGKISGTTTAPNSATRCGANSHCLQEETRKKGP